MMTSSFSYRGSELGYNTKDNWFSLRSQFKGERPTYIYNLHSVALRAERLRSAFAEVQPQIHYAMKANAHTGLLRFFQKQNFGVDVVSGGEAQRALDHGFEPQKIIFSGVGKSKAEIELALQKNFFQINVESLEELRRVGALAQQLKKKISIGIRINPNIRVETHPYITTGFRENKFGISEYQLSEALEIIKNSQPWVHLQGLSSHLGSQIRDMSPLVESLECLLNVSQTLLQQGHPLKTIDMGGGVGIDYLTDDETKELILIDILGQQAAKILKNSPLKLLIEPGRWLVARAGALCAQVEYVKFNGYKNFIVLNTGMHHLLRPALYKAHHRILPFKRMTDVRKVYDVVGPICESSDVIGQDRWLTPPQEGDCFAIMDAGAYGMSMSSHYNHHPEPLEILV